MPDTLPIRSSIGPCFSLLITTWHVIKPIHLSQMQIPWVGWRFTYARIHYRTVGSSGRLSCRRWPDPHTYSTRLHSVQSCPGCAAWMEFATWEWPSFNNFLRHVKTDSALKMVAHSQAVVSWSQKIYVPGSWMKSMIVTLGLWRWSHSIETVWWLNLDADVEC